MVTLIGLEIKKTKNTFIFVLFLLSIVAPLALVLFAYASNKGANTFFEIVANNCVFIQLLPFAFSVIIGCFIIAREYRDNTMIYLKNTPQSQAKVIFAKILTIVIEVWITQLCTFILLFLINAVVNADSAELMEYSKTGLVSAVTISALVPFVAFISVIRRNFSGSAITILLLYMMTFPLIFSENGSLFPHLLPMVLLGKAFGVAQYKNVGIIYGGCILVVLATLFTYLSVRKFSEEE